MMENNNNSNKKLDTSVQKDSPPTNSFRKYNNNNNNNYQRNENNSNNNNYNNRGNYRNNNNNNNNRNNYNNGRGRNNSTNYKLRHQNRARAALANSLVECSLPSIPLTPDGKVFKQVLVEGTGPTPTRSSVVHVNYVCRLPNGSVLDAFVDAQLPHMVNLHKLTITPAFEICILGMKMGEKCLLTTSYEYGYGELGCPDRIPAAANLQYEIELFWFNDDFSLVDDGTVARKLAVAEQSKITGNHFFKLKMYRAAVRSYKYGESRLQFLDGASEEEQKKVDEMIVVLNLNLAASALQTRLFDIALINCDRVLTLDPKNIKGLFRVSQAYAGKYDFKTAKETLMKAIKLKPNDVSLREEYESLKKKEIIAKQNAEGGLRGVFNKENSLELFTESEMERMKQDRIALAGARMFV